MSGYDDIIAQITDSVKQEKENRKIDEECTVIEATVEKLIAENARCSIDQKEYNHRYNTYATQYNELQKRRQEISSEIAMCRAKQNLMKAFIGELKKQETLLTEFDESLWCATVSAVIVKSDKELTFQFKDGTELPWSMEHRVI